MNGAAPKPNTAQTAGQQRSAASQQAAQPRPAGTAQSQPRPAGAGQPQPKLAAEPNSVSQPKAPVKSQADNVQRPVNTAKPKQEFKSKNFEAEEDDDFEYDFLNWDGDEEI